MSEAVQLYPETTPVWLRTIMPIETPQEKYRRIQGEIRKAEKHKKTLEAAHRDQMDAIDDRLLFLMDQNLRAIAELEAAGEDV